MNITPYIDHIQDLNPNNQRVWFRGNHWKKWVNNNPTVSHEMNHIVQEFPNGITRGDIIDHLSAPNGSLLRGFIMTMVWGHGYTEHGRADNRGPWKVSEMLSPYDQSLEILQQVKSNLENDDLHAAYVSFNEMKKCRVNFFSKFLYFLGRSLNMKIYPLIFDARVAKSIGLLNSVNQGFCNVLSIEPNQTPEAYVQYVNEMHEISAVNGFDADKLELFLFNGL